MFLESYRKYPAGIDHDFYVAFKGFPNEATLAAGRNKTYMDFNLPASDSSVDRIALGSVFTHLFEEQIVHYIRDWTGAKARRAGLCHILPLFGRNSSCIKEKQSHKFQS